MSSGRPSAARRIVILAAILAFAGLASACAPSPAVTVDPPPARAVLSPSSGPAGSFVNVAPPDGSCLSDGVTFGSLQAAVTIPSSGVVIAQGYQYLGVAISEYAAPDPFVRLRVPPATAPGTYLVYLSCYSYLDQYAYSPATFTVTPG